MKKISLKSAVKKLFEFRPDEAYSLDDIYKQFRQWRAKAYRCKLDEGILNYRRNVITML